RWCGGAVRQSRPPGGGGVSTRGITLRPYRCGRILPSRTGFSASSAATRGGRHPPDRAAHASLVPVALADQPIPNATRQICGTWSREAPSPPFGAFVRSRRRLFSLQTLGLGVSVSCGLI